MQMVSLLHMAEITEEGVTFETPRDGRMLLTPEQSIAIQNRLGAQIHNHLLDPCTQKLSLDAGVSRSRACNAALQLAKQAGGTAQQAGLSVRAQQYSPQQLRSAHSVQGRTSSCSWMMLCRRWRCRRSDLRRPHIAPQGELQPTIAPATFAQRLHTHGTRVFAVSM